VEAFSYRPVAMVRVVGSSPALRGQVRRFATAPAKAEGFEFDEAQQAVRGAAAVLVEALAAGSRGVLVPAAAAPLAEAAQGASVPLWGVAAVGRVLPDQLLEEVLRRAGDGVELIETARFDLVAGPAGLEAPVQALARGTCPPAPELFVRVR